MDPAQRILGTLLKTKSQSEVVLVINFRLSSPRHPLLNQLHPHQEHTKNHLLEPYCGSTAAGLSL